MNKSKNKIIIILIGLIIVVAAIFLLIIDKDEYAFKSEYKIGEQALIDDIELTLNQVTHINNNTGIELTFQITNKTNNTITINADKYFVFYDINMVQIPNKYTNDKSIIKKDETITYKLQYDVASKELYEIYFYSQIVENNIKFSFTSSEIIHSLSFNAKVTITGEIENWYQIDYQDQVGYVSKKYISDTRLPETTSRGGVDRTAKANTSQETEKKEEASSTQNNVEEQKQTSNSNVTGAQVVEYAKQYLGYKYKAGGATPSTGFDCSGFTSYVFKHFGISLNRSSSGQIKNGIAVEKNNLQQGDILVYKNESKTAIGHVGIYIGNGNFIHSANKKEGVKITSTSSSYYSQRYVGARRVI